MMGDSMGDFGLLPAELRQQIFTYVLAELEFEICVDGQDTFILRWPKPIAFASLQICRMLRYENMSLQHTVPTLVFRHPEHLGKFISGQLQPAWNTEHNSLPEYCRLRSVRLHFLEPLYGYSCFDADKKRENRDADYKKQTKIFLKMRDDWHRVFKRIPPSIRYVQFDFSSKPNFKLYDLNMVGRFVSLLSTLAYLRSERQARSSIVGCREEFEHKLLEAFIPGRAFDAERLFPFDKTPGAAVPQARG